MRVRAKRRRCFSRTRSTGPSAARSVRERTIERIRAVSLSCAEVRAHRARTVRAPAARSEARTGRPYHDCKRRGAPPEHLSYCVALYPTDAELAEARTRFVELRDDLRARLSSGEAQAIDEAVAEEMRRREEAAKQPASGLGEEEVSAPSEPVMERVKWKLPVVISLASAGVASGVFGGVMLARSGELMGEADDLRGSLPTYACSDDEPPSECASIEDKLKNADTTKNLGVGLAVGGGALLLSAIVVQVLVPNKTERKATGLSSTRPLVGVSGDGFSLSLSGQF